MSTFDRFNHLVERFWRAQEMDVKRRNSTLENDVLAWSGFRHLKSAPRLACRV